MFWNSKWRKRGGMLYEMSRGKCWHVQLTKCWWNRRLKSILINAINFISSVILKNVNLRHRNELQKPITTFTTHYNEELICLSASGPCYRWVEAFFYINTIIIILFQCSILSCFQLSMVKLLHADSNWFANIPCNFITMRVLSTGWSWIYYYTFICTIVKNFIWTIVFTVMNKCFFLFI